MDDMEKNENFYKYCLAKKAEAMQGRRFIFFEVLCDKLDDGVLFYLPTLK